MCPLVNNDSHGRSQRACRGADASQGKNTKQICSVCELKITLYLHYASKCARIYHFQTKRLKKYGKELSPLPRPILFSTSYLEMRLPLGVQPVAKIIATLTTTVTCTYVDCPASNRASSHNYYINLYV